MEDALVFALRIQEITYSAIYNEIFAKSTRKPPQKMARDGASLVNSCVNRSQSSVSRTGCPRKGAIFILLEIPNGFVTTCNSLVLRIRPQKVDLCGHKNVN